MNVILIALKEGTTLYTAGTLFEIEDTIITKQVEGLTKNYYQLPDDAMGRVALVETNHVVLCTAEMLTHALPGHGVCYFSKSELSGHNASKFRDDFSARNISMEDQYGAWLLKWRVPEKNEAGTSALFTNKVTSETITLEAMPLVLDYDLFSIDSKTYEQTKRRRKGLHYLWDLGKLKPGFYMAEINVDSTTHGFIHLVKHFPILLNVADTRKTSDVQELGFSEEIWNSALDIMLAWGPQMNIPFQVRLLEHFPELTWAEANHLEKICKEASSFAWRMYEQEAQQTISLSEASSEISTTFPWINDENQSRLRSQGQYYARK